MLDKIRTAIKKYRLFDSVGTVTVALSGGADSVSLLHALLSLKDELGVNIEAAHLNHGIRGQEADNDEAYVKSLCQRLGVKLYTERADVPKIAEQKGESLELAARNVRYDFLGRVAKGVIATAHTANDNIETVIFNMSRGAGLDGLCGIPPKRDNIIRPLILATRQEVERYCADNGLEFCTDSTNSEVFCARNRIRINVIPELQKVNEGAVINVSRLCGNLSDDAEYLNSVAETAFLKAFKNDGLLVNDLCEQPISIRKRMITKLCETQTGMSPEEVHVSAICDMCTSAVGRTSYKGDFEATVRKGILRLEKKSKSRNFAEITVDKFPFKTENLDIEIESKEHLENSQKFNNLFLKNALDCDKICGKLTLRHRIPGDSIRLQGRNVTKTLKKLFNEADLSAEDKNRLMVLSDEKGILWVEDFGADERVSVDATTKRVIIVNKF